jgi:hypothetical protein
MKPALLTTPLNAIGGIFNAKKGQRQRGKRRKADLPINVSGKIVRKTAKKGELKKLANGQFFSDKKFSLHRQCTA